MVIIKIINIIILLTLCSLSIIGMVTDIRRQEIDHWISIVGAIIILIGVGTRTIDKTILSWNFSPIQLTLLSSIIAGLIIFVLFMIIPVGGGDTKFLAMISLFLGAYETLFMFTFACIIVAIYTDLTNRKYKRENDDKFKNANTKAKKRKILMKRQVPLMIGICPATIIALLLQLYPLIRIFISLL